MDFRWFPSPPPVSPSAVPALGVGLMFNTLMLAGIGLAWFHGWPAKDDLVKTLLTNVPCVYAALSLALAVVYGIAGAAWTGWSWWRVPVATLAAATLGWTVNVVGVAWWAHQAGWPVAERFSWQDPEVSCLMGLGAVSLAVLGLLLTTLWRRTDS